MKQKNFAVLYLLLISAATILTLYMPQAEASKSDETLVIPNEAIRLRILADSDSPEDQELKRQVRDAVNAEITNWVQDIASIDEARALIQSKVPEIEKIAIETVKAAGMDQDVAIEFGKVNFPTKLYGQFLYPAGEYEAILITLGEGSGANWWCVLFPPLCFLDFSNGEATSAGFDGDETAEKEEQTAEKPPVYEEEEEAEVEVRFFLVDLFSRIFG